MGATIRFRPLEGTTQGGINGPDIWIICLWAIIFTRACRTSKTSKFADDLLSALMGHDLKVLRDVLQTCLDEFVEWFTTRGLKISAQKSFCLIVNRGRKPIHVKPLKIGNQEVPFVDSFKYLGVIIDKDLSWKEHIRSRIRKAKSDLMIARKLVSNNWGLTPDKSEWLYKSIVRPALDYSCQAWVTPKGLPVWAVKELDKVQRLALTSMTACTYTTPTRALERLTNTLPLELHLMQKAANTIARIANNIDRSNWDGIGTQNKRGHLFQWTKYLGASLPPINVSNTYNFTGQKVCIGDGKHDMCGVSIYTDGSKTDLGTGSGWAIFNDRDLVVRGNRRLPDHATVYEAEMLAISFALDDLLLVTKGTGLPKDATFLIDNQATLKTLNSIKLSGELRVNTVKKLKSFQVNYGMTFSFRWIRGHSGNVGNDIADEQAKLGCENSDVFFIKPSLAFIKKKIKEKVRAEWNSRWTNLTDCRQSRQLISFEPSDKEKSFLFSKGRQGTRKLTALLTGHNNLKYHVFVRKVSTNPHASPCCRLCECDLETSWHLLYDCPRLDMRRREFIFSPDNPKKGPDIEWYFDLAVWLGIWDWLLDRKYLDRSEGQEM